MKKFEDKTVQITEGTGSFNVLACEYYIAPDWMRNGFEWILRIV